MFERKESDLYRELLVKSEISKRPKPTFYFLIIIFTFAKYGE